MFYPIANLLHLKEIIVLLLYVAAISNCVKSIKNNNVNDDDIITSKPGYSSIDLSRSLNEMNDATEIITEVNKKEARPEEDIVSFIRNKLESLKFAYDKRMYEKGPFDGNIKFEFQIISTGEVISIKVLSSSIEDTTFISDISKRILKWNFGKIDKKNDTSKVIYPFVFDF